MTNHKFVVIVNGKKETYTSFESIPKTIDEVIAFLPQIPQPPHTKEQHAEIDMWPDRLNELMERTKNARRNTNR